MQPLTGPYVYDVNRRFSSRNTALSVFFIKKYHSFIFYDYASECLMRNHKNLLREWYFLHHKIEYTSQNNTNFYTFISASGTPSSRKK